MKPVIKLNISDLKKIKEENGVWVSMNGQNDGTRFSRDPDLGTLNDRLSGKFDWAFKQIAKKKDVATHGNIDSLQPDFEFGLLDGTEVDFDQYMIHNPRCLGRIVQNQAPNGERTINLAVGIGMSGATNSIVLAENSASVLSVVQKYEEAGYAVRLHAFFPFMESYNSDHIGAVIVDCSMASVGQAVSILCSALVFRSIIFDAIEKVGHSPNNVQAVSRHQNSYKINAMRKLVMSQIGRDTKIIFTGDTEEDIKKELAS